MNQYLFDRSAFQNFSSVRFQGAPQVVGEFLRAATRIVVPQKVGKPQQGIEQVGSPAWQRAPMRSVGDEQRFQPRIAKVLVQFLRDGVGLELFGLLCFDVTKEIEEPVLLSGV